MIERCLRLGASIDLLNQYFGMTSLEVSARRRLSGDPGKCWPFTAAVRCAANGIMVSLERGGHAGAG